MISFEEMHNHSLGTPPDLGPVLASLSRAELRVVLESVAPMLGSSESPGIVSVAEVLARGAQWELTDREVRKVKDTAALAMLDAEFHPPVTDPVGDTTGIPPWSQVSGDVGPVQ